MKRDQIERLLIETVGEKPSRLVKGSIIWDGMSIDWTEQTPRGLVARSAYCSPPVIADHLRELLRDGDA